MTASRNVHIAPDGAEIHDSILGAPDEAVISWAFGHQWQPKLTAGERKGYGTKVREVIAECPCGRERRDIIGKSGHLYARTYTGGHKVRAGRVDVEEARGEWARRERAKDAAAKRAAKRAAEQSPPPAGSASTTTEPGALALVPAAG